MKKGFTIIEIVITLAIFAIISIVIGSLYVSHSNLYRIEAAAADIKSQKIIFVKNFQETGKAANAIVASRQFEGVTYTSSSSTIIFKLPGIDINGDIINGIFDYSVFYKNGNNLYIETDTDALSLRKNITRKLSDISQTMIFRYNSANPADASYASVSLFLKNGELFQEEISFGIYLRNK